MEDTHTYLNTIRKSLQDAQLNIGTDQYLDLATTEYMESFERLSQQDFPSNNLADFQELVVREVNEKNLDKVKLAINELLKHLITNISADNETELTNVFLYRLRMIFKRCIGPDYPYAEEIWIYICECLRFTGVALLSMSRFLGVKEVVDSFSQMGHLATSYGLSTSSTQASLRIIENGALSKNQDHLASICKNVRFNLEV